MLTVKIVKCLSVLKVLFNATHSRVNVGQESLSAIQIKQKPLTLPKQLARDAAYILKAT